VRYGVVAVGKMQDAALRKATEAYATRARRWCQLSVTEVKASGSGPAAVLEEGRRLSAALEGHVVVLDERGERLTTRAFAAAVNTWELGGTSRVTFVVGGADGLDKAVKDRASAAWRLSDFTLPHELARLMLLEQIYRVESLRAGHPYHRD
jgi:23S rRNA (pseudouridine1915-N3)-methyltransferase